MEQEKIIIAIDGHSSCGKSTLAKDLARVFDYIYVDTGAMYRAVTLYFLENNVNIESEKEIEKALDEINIHFELAHSGQQETFLNDVNVEKSIRSPQVAGYVSPVAAISAVRTKLVSQQRALGIKKGVVMDGRDIGTVVFPKAEVKLFLTADPEVRAHRRYKELISKGVSVTLNEVKHNLKERDRIDTTRTDSPLIAAKDAIIVDNSNIGIEDQLDMVLKLIKEKRS